MSDSILRVSGVTKRFGGLVAVDNVSFDVPTGEVFALIGPNGAGKTTLFNCITGVYKPTLGTVTFLDKDLTGAPPHRAAKAGIGRTFQNIRLFEYMSALDNVRLGHHSRSELQTPLERLGAAERLHDDGIQALVVIP